MCSATLASFSPSRSAAPFSTSWPPFGWSAPSWPPAWLGPSLVLGCGAFSSALGYFHFRPARRACPRTLQLTPPPPRATPDRNATRDIWSTPAGRSSAPCGRANRAGNTRCPGEVCTFMCCTHCPPPSCAAAWRCVLLPTRPLTILPRPTPPPGDAPAWRIFSIVCSVPATLSVVSLFFAPESPKWLSNAGRTKEAEAILRRMIAVRLQASEHCLGCMFFHRTHAPCPQFSQTRARRACRAAAQTLA